MILENFLVDPEIFSKHFDPLDLCRIAPVSKNLNELVNICFRKYKLNDLSRFQKTSTDSTTCKYCKCALQSHFSHDDYVFTASSCNDCFRAFYISRTDAKNKYNLTNNDLKNIPHVAKYIAIYKRIANYFCENDVKRLSLLVNKSGKSCVYNKSYLSRINKLDSFYKKNNMKEIDLHEMQYNNIISPFKRNGKGGIRGVEYAIRRWNQFDKNCLSFVEQSDYLQESEKLNICLCYSLGDIDEILAIEELAGIAYRRCEIFKEFARRTGNRDGIDYNYVDTVPVCSDYIHYGMFNISEIVDVLLVEIFIRDNTDYSIHDDEYCEVFSDPNNNIIDLDNMYLTKTFNTKKNSIEKWIIDNPDSVLPEYVIKWVKDN
jgi:hypothetical protein